MRVSSDADGKLVVTNLEVFLMVLCVGFTAVGVGVWLSSLALRGKLGWSVLCLIFALATLSAVERSRFVFDRATRRLTWERRTPLRRSTGVVPFAQITGLSLERDFAPSGQRGNARRLVVHTTEGPLPVTRAFTGIGNAAEDAGIAIQRYLNASDPSREIPFVRSEG